MHTEYSRNSKNNNNKNKNKKTEGKNGINVFKNHFI